MLGISPEAVRARIKRGTLTKEKGEDGTVYVWLDADQPQWDGDRAGDGTDAQPLIVARLENEVEFLRRELERKDHLLAMALERIPALEEASPQPRESPETVSEESGKDDVPSEKDERVSWWRKVLGV
jgi:hypothetical protein